jgi:hypothetical protein
MKHPMDASAEPELFWERNSLDSKKHGGRRKKTFLAPFLFSANARQANNSFFAVGY